MQHSDKSPSCMCACVFKCVCMPVCICMCEEKKQRVGTDIEGELWDWQQERDERCAVVILEDCFGPVMYECESFWEARSQVCLLTGTFGIILVEIHSEIMGDLCVGQRTQSLLPHQKDKPNQTTWSFQFIDWQIVCYFHVARKQAVPPKETWNIK